MLNTSLAGQKTPSGAPQAQALWRARKGSSYPTPNARRTDPQPGTVFVVEARCFDVAHRRPGRRGTYRARTTLGVRVVSRQAPSRNRPPRRGAQMENPEPLDGTTRVSRRRHRAHREGRVRAPATHRNPHHRPDGRTMRRSTQVRKQNQHHGEPTHPHSPRVRSIHAVIKRYPAHEKVINPCEPLRRCTSHPARGD